MIYHIGDYVRLWVDRPCTCCLRMPRGVLSLTSLQTDKGDYFVHFIASIVGDYQLDVPGGEPICFEVVQ
jgi:hypothetical protein